MFLVNVLEKNKTMKTLRRVQTLPVSLEKAWRFFSDPGNLKLITPDYMGFEIISEKDYQQMYPGMIIAYRIKPMLNIPMTWVTEITQVREPFYFIDKQIKGPYQFWHHQHLFCETKDGVEMEDILHYAVPGGILGKVVESFIVEKRVIEIFDYRFNKLKSMFGEPGF